MCKNEAAFCIEVRIAALRVDMSTQQREMQEQKLTEERSQGNLTFKSNRKVLEEG
jgi:hypothetical protein